MKKKRRSAKHWTLLALALALALLVGVPIPPGLTQNKAAKPPTRQQGSGDSRKADTSRAQTAQSQSDDALAPVPEPPGKIAFASDRDGNFEIYVMNPDGGGLVRVTNNPAEDTHPTWSPDGRRLAFVSNRDGNKEIYVVNADGSGTTRLTNNTAEDFEPAWSPSTTTPKIAFVSHRDGNDEIYAMNTDGTGQTNLTNNTGDDINPAYIAGTGTLIAFASNRDGDKFEIYRMNADGTSQTRLTNNAFNDLAPTWPPGFITFQTDRDGNDEIYTMSGTGANQTRVTNNAAFDLDPARSSDGARLAFVSNRNDTANLEIYGANADGSVVVRLTNNPASDIDPAIQPIPSDATLGTVQLSAATYTVGEGQRGVDITVTRTGGSGVAFVTISTVSGTASDRTDFISIFRQVTFGVGETSKTINIPIIDDFRVEGDEMFTVTLSGPINTTLGTPNTATVTIVDNDSGVPPLAATLFGVTAAGNLVRFSSATPGTLDLNVAITGLQSGETIQGLDTRPASLGVDTRPASRQLYALGSSGRIYRLNPVTGVATQVSTLTGATLTGTAFGVDFNPVPDRLRVVSDADQNLRINVDNGAATVDTTLAYAAGDPNAGQNPNVVGVAYTNNFAGATTVTLYGIDSARDALVRQGSLNGSPVSPNSGQLFTVGALGVDTSDVVGFDIANPSGVAFASLTVGGTSQLYTINLTTGAATLLGSIGGTSPVRGLTATSPPTNPIDDIAFFVRQQYLDFLNREPETAGFNAWFNVLANCSDLFNAPGCDRVTVSSAFFGSPEFQLRGTFAMRFYLAALNRLPTYREFVRDMSALGGETAAEVLANRARFPDDFVQRDEFRMIFDTLSNAAYVDRLIANTGVSFANRNQLVADLDAGTKTRAQVLREIVDSQQFVQAAYNRTFVLAEYFGYLGRDADTAGFNAWLAFLNANPNDFRTMVRGFLDSVEYRARFGPP
jgi:Tol biopolymer transport system component